MGRFQQILLKTRSFLGSKIYPKWAIANSISEEAILYRTVHYTQVNRNTYNPSSAAFKDLELSCDWNKYSSPEQTRQLMGKQYKYPVQEKRFKNVEHYFVLKLLVKDVYKIQNVDERIKHDPIQFFPVIKGNPNNRAHSLVIGNREDKQRVKNRKLLANCSKWEVFDKSTYDKLISEAQ